MSFKISTIAGKHYLIRNQFKYRDYRTLTNGTLSGRCCVKDCSSWVKTDKKKENIVDFKSEHKHKTQIPSPLLSASTPRLTRSTAAAPPPTPLTPSLPSIPHSPVPQTSRTDDPEQLSRSSTTDLLTENVALKDQLTKLQAEMEIVLNHSIESDQRLAQYTSDIFSTKSSTTTTTKTADQIIQTEPQTCKACVILKEETGKMINSIRMMEEEIRRLKSTTYSKGLQNISNEIPLKNRFNALQETQNEENDSNFTIVTRKNSHSASNQTKEKKLKIYKKLPEKHNKIHTTPFSNVTITGDSHARHLAALTRERIHRRTTVTGMCKPGAGLRSVAPSTTFSPPGHCHVLLAGTNDVTAGRQDIIYSHLEGILQDCSKTSRVLLVSLPYRHDLPPGSPVHNNVSLANNVMSELCRRNDGVEFLDISDIPRRHFTAHGLHLRARGKHLLADLITERLALMKLPLQQPKPSPLMRRVELTSPRFLAHETYARAVSANNTTFNNSPLNISHQQHFLVGAPLEIPVQN